MLTGEMYKCKSCKTLQTVREFLSLDEGKAAYYVTCLACGNSYVIVIPEKLHNQKKQCDICGHELIFISELFIDCVHAINYECPSCHEPFSEVSVK